MSYIPNLVFSNQVYNFFITNTNTVIITNESLFSKSTDSINCIVNIIRVLFIIAGFITGFFLWKRQLKLKQEYTVVNNTLSDLNELTLYIEYIVFSWNRFSSKMKAMYKRDLIKVDTLLEYKNELDAFDSELILKVTNLRSRILEISAYNPDLISLVDIVDAIILHVSVITNSYRYVTYNPCNKYYRLRILNDEMISLNKEKKYIKEYYEIVAPLRDFIENYLNSFHKIMRNPNKLKRPKNKKRKYRVF